MGAMKKWWSSILLVIIIVVVFGIFLARSSNKTEEIAEKIVITPTPVISLEPSVMITPTVTQEEFKFDASKKYTVTLTTTEGEVVVAMNVGQTPKTVENFLTLVNKGFYNNTIFHRVIKGFMIQGGDPKGDGTGGPGYKFADEPFTGEYTRGTIAMANSGPNTNGSQFFIMHKDYPLPKNYVIFGKVESGLEVVDKIAEAPVKTSMMGEASTPVSPVKVISAKVNLQP